MSKKGSELAVGRKILDIEERRIWYMSKSRKGGYKVRKVVTVCGSVRFWDKIQEMSERLELENGYAVIGITPHVGEQELTKQEKELLGELHKVKIDLSDAIFVVNVGGYIGESVKSEIEYAKEKGKEIIFLETASLHE